MVYSGELHLNKVFEIEDRFSYRGTFSVPKFIGNSNGFLIIDSHGGV